MRRSLLRFAASLAFVTTSCAGTGRPERTALAASEPAARSKGEALRSEFWSKVYNPPQDLDAIDRLCTNDFVLSNPSGTSSGARRSRSGCEPSAARFAICI